MADALTIAVQGMHNDMQRMENISLNVANSTTPGYRRTLSVNASFAAVLDGITQSGSGRGIGVTLPTVTTVLDLTAGPIKATGQPLDLALNGDGYFEVMTPTGAAYTRAGNFHLDEAGRLVNQDGYPVSGRGGEIVVNSKNALTISPEGEVSDGENVIAQLRLVDFVDKNGLQMQAQGLLTLKHAGTEQRDATATVQAGYLESANVVPLNEMVHMMETSRHFETQQKLFQGYDEQMSSAIQKLGQF